MNESTYCSLPLKDGANNSQHPVRATGILRVSLYFLLIGNGLCATVHAVGLLFWGGNLSSTFIVWFDSIRTVLYFIDLYAIYLLFNLKPLGFKLLVATSTLYALSELTMAYTTITGLTKGIVYVVLLYVITGIIAPFLDVWLVHYLSGNKSGSTSK